MLTQLLNRLPNLTPVLLVLGSAAIAMSLWAPILSGHRVARNEERADAFTEAVLIGALASQPFAFDVQEDVDRVVKAIRTACEGVRAPESTFPKFERGELSGTGIYLHSKHYRFLLTRRPPPTEQKADYDPHTFELLEAYGWPRLISSPGRTAFYHGEHDRSSFTRNLISKYVGDRTAPKGGHAREVSRFVDLREKHHRGAKEERWLHAPIGIRANRIAGALMRAAIRHPLRPRVAMSNLWAAMASVDFTSELLKSGVWFLFLPTFVPEETSADRLVWQDRQYKYALVRKPEGTDQALEVYAWPREKLHPPGLVIYYPETGEPAVSENNELGSYGDESVPMAGDGVWISDPDEKEQTTINSFYFGGRGRWIRFEDFKVRALTNMR